ncbi:phage/plasmid primase, P4 family [Lysinibacillus sp. FSL H8-0500]|uniref:phage/plasmid primase, P4 family n=1 Tax=Lysinibacillus sp. FSL H8-0500 TaxID=2921393 RepID=UPI003100FC22
MPYDPVIGERAKPDQPSTFKDFNSTVSAVSNYDGIGLLVDYDICVIDLDDCFDSSGKLKPIAQNVVDAFSGCYMERSPSRKGLHIFFKASGFIYNKTKYYINNRKLGIEVYVAGATHRFVTVTGNVFASGDVPEKSEDLQMVLDKYMLRPNPVKQLPDIESQSYLSDKSVIEKAVKSANGERFKALWQGDTSSYASPSEADLALCGMLAFWCGRDVKQMDRLFRKSGLMRDKWNRTQSGSTYGKLTIQKAIASVTEIYKPGGKRSSATEDFEEHSLADLKPENNERYPWTDIGASRLFADYYKTFARYVPERKMWFCYENGVWTPDIGNLKVMEMCKSLANQLLTYALTIPDEHQRKAYIDYCRKWQLRRYRETVLKDAQSVYPISMAEFDQDPFVLNCANGTLFLTSMDFRPHNSEDRLTRISGVKYEPEAKSERWDAFIHEIMSGDEEKAKFLQKAFGYGISGDTRFECLFVLYGATTRNGKGTLCESILKVLGSYGCTARPETISLKNNNNSSSPSEDIARLAGVRFVNISEPSRGLVLNAAQVKSMTGGDTINARFLHENSFDFSPKFKLYINTNYLPVITDMTLFSSGRVVIIPFERHFDESEQDKSLKREFAKPKNQSAILNWLIEGYQQLKKEGLTLPDSVKVATEAYKHDSDKIALFFEDALEESPNSEVRTSEVYARYQRWCSANGCYSENARNFKQALSAIARVERKRPRSGGGMTTLLIGYKLANDDEFFLL